MQDFLGVEIDKDKVFILPHSAKEKMQTAGIDNDFSDGLYRLTGDFIIVYYSNEETLISIEQKVVHESFHKTGLGNIIISQSRKGSDYTFDVTARRLGFALVNAGENSKGNPSPGLLLEEMAASYAGLTYLQKYADEDYWRQVDIALTEPDIDTVSKQLGKKYILLNSSLQSMSGPSLYAFMFDRLRFKLGLDSDTNPQDVVKAAIAYRKDSTSIKRFIARLEQVLGKGSYSTLRGIDVSTKMINGNDIQKAIDLILA
jgi:hypothetical protein